MTHEGSASGERARQGAEPSDESEPSSEQARWGQAAVGESRGTLQGTQPTLHESSKEYKFVQELLRVEAGIVLDAQKHYLIETRMAALARAEALTVSGLFEKAFAGQQGIRRKIVEAMTTNETSFFRDPAIFRSLIYDVLAHLLRAVERDFVQVWCGACSTGQEPYSFAMGARQRFGVQAERVRIVATDLDTDALERAKSGLYSQLEVNRGLPASNLVRFFEKKDYRWQVKDEVRSMVEFRSVNLVRPFTDLGTFDLILLRNVLIYFDAETKEDVLHRAVRLLSPEGLLVLGSTESLLGHQVPVEPRQFGRCTVHGLRKSGR